MQPDLGVADHPKTLFGALNDAQASIGWSGGRKVAGTWLFSESVIAGDAIPPTPTEDRASARMLA